MAAQICKAKQINDQKMCFRCGIQWDVNDPEPPECKSNKTLAEEKIAQEKSVAERELIHIQNLLI